MKYFWGKVLKCIKKILRKYLKTITGRKMKFSSKDFFSKCDQIRIFQRICVTLTKEILNGKLHFSGSVFRQVAILKSINRILENLKKMEKKLIFCLFYKSFVSESRIFPNSEQFPSISPASLFLEKVFHLHPYHCTKNEVFH